MSDGHDISDESLIVLRRGRGRPRLSEPKSRVSTWVWAKHHDYLIQLAKKDEKSVSAVVRDILQQAVRRRES